MKRTSLGGILVLIAAVVLVGAWYVRRATSSNPSFSAPTESNQTASTPTEDANKATQTDTLRSVEELRVLYPDLFSRLDTSVYEGEPFDGREALSDFRTSPSSQKRRDAYEAIVRAVAVQLRTIPDECQTQIAAYDAATRDERYDIDLGDIPARSLDSFLKVRSALVEGLANPDLPTSHRQAALEDIQLGPRIFTNSSLITQLRDFANSSDPEAGAAKAIASTIETLSSVRVAKLATEDTVCKLRQ